MQALERKVVGQPRAVSAAVRAATITLASPFEGAAHQGPFLFVGPTGTGKTHLARTLARVLHGDHRHLAWVDCVQLPAGDEWPSFLRQVAPHFSLPSSFREGAHLRMARSTLLVIEHLEWCHPDLVRALLWTLRSGLLDLPNGRRGALAGSIVLLTSSLGAREILETSPKGIGFSPLPSEQEVREKARIYQVCRSVLERAWGTDAVSCLEDVVVFHPIRLEHMPTILDLALEALNERGTPRGLRCELDESARRFLVDHGGLSPQFGAWWLVRAFRRFVEFPVADLLGSGAIPLGSTVAATHAAGEDRLRFHVSAKSLDSTRLDFSPCGPIPPVTSYA